MNQNIEEILENIKKEQDFFKKAKLLKSLKNNKQVSITEIAEKINIKPSYISHILRLNKLPELIVDGYYSNTIPISHLFIISRLKNENEMISIYEKALEGNLTALQTEELVRQELYNVKNEGEYLRASEIDPFIKRMEKKGIRLKIIQSRIKGKIILEMNGNLIQTSKELRSILKSLQSDNSTQGESSS